MTRINLINPVTLSDQHLIAEYNELPRIFTYAKKYPIIDDNFPKSFRLGIGHVKFFKNKLLYLYNRFNLIKKEMDKRVFYNDVKIDLSLYPNKLRNDWIPILTDYYIIIKRLKEKINLKENYYRYYGIIHNNLFFINLLDKFIEFEEVKEELI